MELQDLVTTSKTLQLILPISGQGEHLNNGSARSSSSDLQEGTALQTNIGQRLWVGQAIARLAPNERSSESQSRINYACASDEHLVEAAKVSDGRAFEELSNRHRKSISNVVYRIVGNREDTEDVVQDSLLKAYSRLSDFRGSCSFSTWVTTIAINTARMLLRKRRARPELRLVQSSGTDQMERIWDIPDPSPGTEQRYSKQKTLEFLSRAVNRLPESYRNVLEQYHAQEKPMREVADTLGISVASAKSRLFRARRILRSRLQGQRLSILDAC